MERERRVEIGAGRREREKSSLLIPIIHTVSMVQCNYYSFKEGYKFLLPYL